MTTPNLRELQVLFDQRVPMRDGITLSADVYLPADELENIGKRPVILTRTPYMKTKIGIYEAARYFVRFGYIFVAIDVRGRGDSEGSFSPGADTCARP